jgi:hypothetical protein
MHVPKRLVAAIITCKLAGLLSDQGRHPASGSAIFALACSGWTQIATDAVDGRRDVDQLASGERFGGISRT